MRILALDIGDKTIGVAMSDSLGITAQGLETIERVGIRKDASKVIKLIRENEVGTLVIGLPINLKGEDSVQTEKVRDFTELIKNKLKSEGLSKVKVVFEDERFTTKIAEQVLIDGNLRRNKRKDVIDKQAAIIILQSYLEKNNFNSI